MLEINAPHRLLRIDPRSAQIQNSKWTAGGAAPAPLRPAALTRFKKKK